MAQAAPRYMSAKVCSHPVAFWGDENLIISESTEVWFYLPCYGINLRLQCLLLARMGKERDASDVLEC